MHKVLSPCEPLVSRDHLFQVGLWVEKPSSKSCLSEGSWCTCCWPVALPSTVACVHVHILLLGQTGGSSKITYLDLKLGGFDRKITRFFSRCTVKPCVGRNSAAPPRPQEVSLIGNIQRWQPYPKQTINSTVIMR